MQSTEPRQAPYGSWRSPISAALIARGATPLAMAEFDGSNVYWAEGRPTEGGRHVVVQAQPSGQPAALTPEGFNARTRVHEYGGGAWLVSRGTVYFSNYADQRLYRQDPGGQPHPITPEPSIQAGARYADGRVTPDGRRLICVRERHHPDREPTNELVAVPTDGSAEPAVLATGADFYAAPRVSHDGRWLAWLQWDHPRMPWDGTELWSARLSEAGTLGAARRIAGGPDESLFQPEWSPDGRLHVISDRTGWWNLYAVGDDDTLQPLAPMDAEFGTPLWVFGLATYGFLGDGRVACWYTDRGVEHLGLIQPGSGTVTPLPLPYTAYASGSLRVSGKTLLFKASTASEPMAVITYDVEQGASTLHRSSLERGVDPKYVSPAQPITFPSANGRDAHALYYPPRNADFSAPDGERPPLLVMSHGGPTSATTAAFDLEIQFWTSRGIAVVDVNYGGSSGYGREYRQRLNGRWGIVDVEDCVAAATYLAERGEVDGRRLAITGGSAGGYTTLAALTFTNTFAAGASHYGVADLEALARDTHKFESRYLDTLVGPYPERLDLYQQRSPIHFTDRLACPVILFQGLDDKVVPPQQAEMMAHALEKKGVPYAYLAFQGEAHGFRKAETIQRVLEAELAFYGQVFGFETPGVPPVPMGNQ